MDTITLAKQIEQKKEYFFHVSDQIWDFAELRYHEFQSAALQQQVLQENGFEVTAGLADISTAFVGGFGHGGPVIGLLGEFDALPNLSQQSDTAEKRPLQEGGSGHGCGHNLLGTASLWAAVAVKEYLHENNLPGTIRYYGCPAEEGGAGKAFMVRAGCFDDVDLCLSWHPGPGNGVFNKALANARVLFQFHGVSSHAAAAPELGRSALDSVEIMSVGVNYLREHITPEARIHYAIVNAGGDAPNVVQSEAAVMYAIRAPKTSQVKEILHRVSEVARGSAIMNGTSYDRKVVSFYSELVPNRTLDRLMQQQLERFVPIGYTQEELEYAQRFVDTVPKDILQEQRKQLAEKTHLTNEQLTLPVADFINPRAADVAVASTDVGNVSWVVPVAQVGVACHAFGTVVHTWQATAQGKSSLAHKGMMTTAKVLAAGAIEIFENPDIARQAHQDFEEALSGESYVSLMPDDVKPGIF